MSDDSRYAPEPGAQTAALLDRAIGEALTDVKAPFESADRFLATEAEDRDGETVLAAPSISAVNRVGLSVTVGAAQRFAMTVSGRIEGTPSGPGFDPANAQAVCTITDRNAPGEDPLQGTLRLAEDGSFTFTVLLEAWPEDRYPQGRLFVINVRARDRSGALGTSTTYLRVPPPAPAPKSPQPSVRSSRAIDSLAHERPAETAARPRTSSLPLYVKGLHLAVKELREEHQPKPVRTHGAR